MSCAAVAGHYLGNLTDVKTGPVLQGQVTGSPSDANLVLNARVELAPEEPEHIVRDALGRVAGRHLRADIRSLRCLRPARPQTTYHYGTVVA